MKSCRQVTEQCQWGSTHQGFITAEYPEGGLVIVQSKVSTQLKAFIIILKIKTAKPSPLGEENTLQTFY